MKIAIVGATGLVGQKMLQVLEEQNIVVDQLIPVASERSIGKKIHFKGREITVENIKNAVAEKPDIAIFSAGSDVSLEFAPLFAKVGTRVIDNSSAWRKDPQIPLVIPEVNAHVLSKADYIIANPNCSTMGMVVAIAPLHRKFGIKRLVISTYQSVSGSGVKGIAQLNSEENGQNPELRAYPHQIYRNIIPHGGTFADNGYTSEEEKLNFETRKILESPEIAITSTVVRVPVTGGHSLSVNIEFEKKFQIEEIYSLLKKASGVIVCDDPKNNIYPMPLMAYDKDDVFVGRIRRDNSIDNGLNLWVVTDNVRKGAATNAVQIAKYLIDNNLLD